MDPIVPGNREEEMGLYFNDDFMDSVDLEENEHLNQLYDVDTCPFNFE